MRARDKEALYRSLAQLLRAGVPFPAALDKLAGNSPKRIRRVLQRLRAAVADKESVGGAFAAQTELLSAMEISVIAAAERGGRLDHGLQQLAEYFGALARARRAVIAKTAYPLFLIHFAILILGVPTLVAGGATPFLREIGLKFGIIYGTVALVAIAFRPLRDMALHSVLLDRLFTMIPLLGKVRRSFALSRFCFSYDLQLEAGVNVIDALDGAARASASAILFRAVQRALPEIRHGGRVGPLLAVSGAFPGEMMRDFMVAEETGGLDKELSRLWKEYQSEAIAALEVASEWGPRLLYLGIVLYIGWQIIRFYLGYFALLRGLTE